MTTDDTQAMTIRLPNGLHEWLRRESFETREAMNAIIVDAVEAERQRREGLRAARELASMAGPGPLVSLAEAFPAEYLKKHEEEDKR